MLEDLTTPSAELIERVANFSIRPGSIDGTVCNFALHYLCDKEENLQNLLKFNAQILKPGGLFMFTCLAGERVFALLKGLAQGQEWVVTEGGVRKYVIRKEYPETTLQPFGQNISVLLPFADKLYSEPLANIKKIIAAAGPHGFTTLVNSSFDSYFENFNLANKYLFDKLTEDDKTFIGLHQIVILQLKAPTVRGGRRAKGGK
jgi:SAM-dependent methyltransferase